MADLAVNTIHVTKGIDRLAVPIANGVAIPVGTLVQEQSGFANHYDGTNTLLGIVLGGENLVAGIPTGDTSLTPDPTVYVDTSGPTIVGIPVAGASAASTLGEYVYCDDSDLANATVTQPTTDAPIGLIVGWRSATDVDVKLFTPTEHIIGVSTAHADWA